MRKQWPKPLATGKLVEMRGGKMRKHIAAQRVSGSWESFPPPYYHYRKFPNPLFGQMCGPHVFVISRNQFRASLEISNVPQKI